MLVLLRGYIHPAGLGEKFAFNHFEEIIAIGIIIAIIYCFFDKEKFSLNKLLTISIGAIVATFFGVILFGNFLPFALIVLGLIAIIAVLSLFNK